MSKVTVTSNDQGIVVIPTSNPDFSFIRVEQIHISMENGWVRKQKRSALINGATEDLKELGFVKGQQIDGKIVKLESLTPFNKRFPDRDLKKAGETGIVCRVDDQPIYSTSVFTTDLTKQDELIAHTNGAEIAAVNNANRIAQRNASSTPTPPSAKQLENAAPNEQPASQPAEDEIPF